MGREAGQKVQVDGVHRGDDNLDLAAIEGFDHEIQDQGALRRSEVDGIAFEQRLGVPVERIIFADRRRVLVIAVYLLTVAAGAEAFGIAGKPRAVGVGHAVEPMVPGGSGGSSHEGKLREPMLKVKRKPHKAQGACSLG